MGVNGQYQGYMNLQAGMHILLHYHIENHILWVGFRSLPVPDSHVLLYIGYCFNTVTFYTKMTVVYLTIDWLLLVLLLSGDIETNPGPVTGEYNVTHTQTDRPCTSAYTYIYLSKSQM